VLLGACGLVYAQVDTNSKSNASVMIGGPCSYQSFLGTAKIISVKRTPDSMYQMSVRGGPDYEGYEIKFTFTPSLPMDVRNIKWVKDAKTEILDKEYTLQLANSWYPGDKFIQKYKIINGAVFNCALNLITSGTCTPLVFKFKDIIFIHLCGRGDPAGR
jgi:hypothetical protein